MFRWKNCLSSLAICLIVFCFCGNVFAAKTHDVSTVWSLANIRTRIEANQIAAIPNTLGFGAHIWHNAESIKLYEKLMGDRLDNQQEKYFI